MAWENLESQSYLHAGSVKNQQLNNGYTSLWGRYRASAKTYKFASSDTMAIQQNRAIYNYKFLKTLCEGGSYLLDLKKEKSDMFLFKPFGRPLQLDYIGMPFYMDSRVVYGYGGIVRVTAMIDFFSYIKFIPLTDSPVLISLSPFGDIDANVQSCLKCQESNSSAAFMERDTGAIYSGFQLQEYGYVNSADNPLTIGRNILTFSSQNNYHLWILFYPFCSKSCAVNWSGGWSTSGYTMDRYQAANCTALTSMNADAIVNYSKYALSPEEVFGLTPLQARQCLTGKFTFGNQKTTWYGSASIPTKLAFNYINARPSLNLNIFGTDGSFKYSPLYCVSEEMDFSIVTEFRVSDFKVVFDTRHEFCGNISLEPYDNGAQRFNFNPGNYAPD